MGGRRVKKIEFHRAILGADDQPQLFFGLVPLHRFKFVRRQLLNHRLRITSKSQRQVHVIFAVGLKPKPAVSLLKLAHQISLRADPAGQGFDDSLAI